LEHQIYQQNKKLKKKTVFRSLKVERGQKYAWTEFAGPTRNPKKIIRTSNQPIIEIFPNKSMFV
jgi:competence transcription factor ComK